MNSVGDSSVGYLIDNLSSALENLRDRCQHLKHKERRAILKNFKRKFWRRHAATARTKSIRHANPVITESRVANDVEYKRQKNRWLRRELKYRLNFERRILERKNRQDCWQKAKKRIDKYRRIRNKKKKSSLNRVDDLFEEKLNYECEYFKISASCPLNFRCSETHTIPDKSRALVLPNYFRHQGLRPKIILNDDDLENDWLETDSEDEWANFLNIVRSFGNELRQNFTSSIFKLFVCENKRPDLMGNVYAELENEENGLEMYGYLKSERNIDYVQFCNLDFSTVNPNICENFRIDQRCDNSNCENLHLLNV